MQLARI